MTWKPRPNQNGRALRLFVESMDVIIETLCFSPGFAVDDFGRAARSVATELRKLLFDGRPLLHAVLQRPRLHPLSDIGAVSGDVYENERTVSLALGTSEGPNLDSVATHKWHIKVYPLHGLRFDSAEKKWSIDPLFDTQEAPLKLNQWLRQRLFASMTANIVCWTL